jgi:hypothetical protein
MVHEKMEIKKGVYLQYVTVLSLHVLVLRNGDTGDVCRAVLKDGIEIRKKKKRLTEKMKSPNNWNLKQTTSQRPFLFALQLIYVE